MNSDFPTAAAALLPAARLLVGSWMLLSVAHLIAAGRSPAAWGPGSALPSVWLRTLFPIQGALAVLLILSGSVAISVACLTLLLASYGWLLFVTGAFWADGSEKMGMIAMAGTLLIALGIGLREPLLSFAGALLAGGQLALCYATAGLSKLPVAQWRIGAALTDAMASRTFGHPGAAAVLQRRPRLAEAASWTVISLETLFPLALIAPRGWLIAALTAMLVFHLGTAVFMGLNKFPWAFAAAYPATLLLGHAVRGALP